MNKPLFPEPSIEGVLHYLEHAGWRDLQEPPPEEYGFIRKMDGRFCSPGENRYFSTYMDSFMLEQDLLELFSFLSREYIPEQDMCKEFDKRQASDGFFSFIPQPINLYASVQAARLKDILRCSNEPFFTMAETILELEENDSLFDINIRGQRLLKGTYPVVLLLHMTLILKAAEKTWRYPEKLIDFVISRKGKRHLYYPNPVAEGDAPAPNIKHEPTGVTGAALELFFQLNFTPKDIKKTIKEYSKYAYTQSIFSIVQVHNWFQIPMEKGVANTIESALIERWNIYRGGFKQKTELPVSDLKATIRCVEALQFFGYFID